MQTDYKLIYKMTAEKHEGSEQEYKDIGNFVFSKLYNEFRKPKSLIIKLKGIGFWYLRRKRMQHVVDNYPPDPNKNLETIDPSELARYQNKVELYNTFKERLKDYESFIEERNQVRKIRRENETLLEPIDGKDQS